MMGWPAIKARSRWGRTVWPNPPMPGKGSWPARIMASRLSLISSLTPRYAWPLARNSARVAGAGWLVRGWWLGCCTIRQYVVIAGLYHLPRSGRGRRARKWVAHFYPVATTTGTVSSDDVAASRALIRDVISDTPVLHSRVLSETVAGPVFLKCENLQRTGSFKVRGAYSRIARLSDAERARGVVAASAGNHAQGVAFAAGRLGCAATVVMPAGAPLPKVEATRGYGAQVVLTGSCVEDCLSEALAHAERTGAVFIHPYDHPDVVAGQGSVGVAIVGHRPQVRTVVVPVGGGGLASGVAGAIKDRVPSISVVGVQAQAVAPHSASQ